MEAPTIFNCVFRMQPPDATASPARGSFTGSFDATAIAGVNTVVTSIDDFSANFGLNTATGSFSIAGLLGTTDVYVTAFDSLNNMLAMKIVRGQNVPGVANGGNPITLAASDAITTSMPVSVANIPGGGFSPPLMVPFPSYVSAHGGVNVGTGFPLATQYAVVNATEAQPGDYYSFNLLAGAATEQVLTRQFLKTTAPVTLTLPNPWAATPPTPARFPTFIFNYTGLAGQPAIADHASLGWTQGRHFLRYYRYCHRQQSEWSNYPDYARSHRASGILCDGSCRHPNNLGDDHVGRNRSVLFGHPDNTANHLERV